MLRAIFRRIRKWVGYEQQPESRPEPAKTRTHVDGVPDWVRPRTAWAQELDKPRDPLSRRMKRQVVRWASGHGTTNPRSGRL